MWSVTYDFQECKVFSSLLYKITLCDNNMLLLKLKYLSDLTTNTQYGKILIFFRVVPNLNRNAYSIFLFLDGL